jgi:hypothetical protein
MSDVDGFCGHEEPFEELSVDRVATQQIFCCLIDKKT